MALLPRTKELLNYLRLNPKVRARIVAPPDLTLLYAGRFFQPVWKEIEHLQRTNADAAAKKMLPQVLEGIETPGQAHPNLRAWAEALDALQPWKENGFVVWRALSGIYASNAVGKVSFYVGSGVTRGEKVFAATELPVLMRNPNVDPLTQDILAYYQSCVQSGETAINFGYIAA